MISLVYRILSISLLYNYFSQAPTILTAYAQFSSSNAYCISNITVIFSADTTTPVVEVRRDLQELVSLTPLKLSSSISHGKWLDYRTMVIYFGTCYEWIEDQGSEMRIIFEPLQGKAIICWKEGWA